VPDVSTLELAPVNEAVANRPAEILLVDDDPKTRLAMEAMLADLDASLVAVSSGKQALFRLLEQDFAVALLDIQMPDLDGFETAELIRARARSRHTPIIFLTAFNQSDREMLRGYGLGAVDFLFKPIVPEILRSKVSVFVELQRKSREIARQAQLLRDAEQREAAQRLSDARARWEADSLREQMAVERAQAEALARKNEELARAVAERDAAAEALVRSNARLALLSDTASRLLLGQQPVELLREVCSAVAAHLGLDIFCYRRMDFVEELLRLEIWSGIPDGAAEALRTLSVGEGIAGRCARDRRRIVVDEATPLDAPPPHRCDATHMRACICVPLVAGGRLIGTLAFGAREPRRFDADEVALVQLVADQVAIALERGQLIGELQARNSELFEGDRRKDEFLAMLAHELRNPLAPIVNSLHVIGQMVDGRTGDPLTRAHLTMDRQVRHLIRLVDDLLDVSRITQGKIELRKERVSLQTIVEQATQIARPLIQARKHSLVVDVPDDRIMLDGDVTRLTQVISNLLNNAAKYTDVGGQITLSAQANDEEAIVRVRDNGIGIRSDMLPRVFELFVQAERSVDRAVGGLGIGLTLVKRLVQLHGGEVVAFSDGVGKGCEMVITIPASVEAEALPRAVAAGGSGAQWSAAARRLRILVVEDNPDIRETLKELLEIEGHEVTLAEDGHRGVECAGTGDEHDVALVDIGLPGLDGYAVARALCNVRKSHGSTLRLIAISGYGQAEDRRRALEAGFDAHLVKPVDPNLLTQLLAVEAERAAPGSQGDA
jgi:signal transduction histidine kinase/DNA-binding response OmpR family regulator